MTIRKLEASEVTFETKVEPDDTPVRGNAMASGDDEFDRETEDGILKSLRSENHYAWCIITIEARWEGFVGSSVLGGNSLKSDADVAETVESHELKAQALDDLNTRLQRIYASVSPLCMREHPPGGFR
jgi:hypothetical protein